MDRGRRTRDGGALKGRPVFLYNMLDLERFRWEGQQALAAGNTFELGSADGHRSRRQRQ
jgi:hypothetical protein